METFTPIEIGLPDIKKESAIVKFYDTICRDASAILFNLEEYLDVLDELELKDFFDFLNGEDPREFLYLAWMSNNNVEIPNGLSIDKVVQLDLIDVPRQKFSDLIKWRKQLLDLIEKGKNELRFYFPIQKLFDYREDQRGFKIPSGDYGFECVDFEEALYNHVRTFTASERENEVIGKVQKFVDILNELAEIGVVTPYKGKWEESLERNILSSIVLTQGETEPFSINKIITKRLVLRKDPISVERVFDDKSFRFFTQYGEPKEILSFVAEKQLAAEPED